MKKAFFLLAFATLFISACQKEKDPASSSEPKTTQESFTFKASIEGMGADSKGTINASHQMLWATGDKIGIYVNDDGWVDKNQPFTLSEGAGTTEGTFTWDNSGSFSDKATAAFYPWQGTGSDNNNVYGGTMYFKLRESYSSYQSGQMLTPLVASLDNSSSPIHFKHAGAAVKVTVNNLPAGVHSIGMSVDGQQIYGDYSINPSNAGLPKTPKILFGSISQMVQRVSGILFSLFPKLPALNCRSKCGTRMTFSYGQRILRHSQETLAAVTSSLCPPLTLPLILNSMPSMLIGP